MTPLKIQGRGDEPVEGINAININPAHQLLSFGLDGVPVVEFWDPRSRSRANLLNLPSNLASPTSLIPSMSVSALASRSDGLSLAVGTTTGHTIAYDLRSTRPLAIKDQGYSLPIHTLQWLEGRGVGKQQLAGDDLIMSVDKKVLKIWDKNNVYIFILS